MLVTERLLFPASSKHEAKDGDTVHGQIDHRRLAVMHQQLLAAASLWPLSHCELCARRTHSFDERNGARREAGADEDGGHNFEQLITLGQGNAELARFADVKVH